MYTFFLVGAVILVWGFFYLVSILCKTRTVKMVAEIIEDNLRIVAIIMGILLVILSIVAISQKLATAEKRIRLQEEYKALRFKVENSLCRDEFNFATDPLVSEVETWNTDVLTNQHYMNNKWIGVFISPAYEELQTIEYEKIKGHK